MRFPSASRRKPPTQPSDFKISHNSNSSIFSLPAELKYSSLIFPTDCGISAEILAPRSGETSTGSQSALPSSSKTPIFPAANAPGRRGRKRRASAPFDGKFFSQHAKPEQRFHRCAARHRARAELVGKPEASARADFRKRRKQLYFHVGRIPHGVVSRRPQHPARENRASARSPNLHVRVLRVARRLREVARRHERRSVCGIGARNPARICVRAYFAHYVFV